MHCGNSLIVIQKLTQLTNLAINTDIFGNCTVEDENISSSLHDLQAISSRITTLELFSNRYPELPGSILPLFTNLTKLKLNSMTFTCDL